MGDDSQLTPTGTVTFLLTDVEGSTRNWEAAPDAMHDAMRRHNDLLAAVIDANGGLLPIEQGEGDSAVAVFGRASDAISAAVTAQQALVGELGHLFRVRMAVHTGEAQVSEEGRYEGPTIIRAARVRACGHGGQILVTRTTADMVADRLPDGVSLVCLGRHHLRDLNRPEEIWQIETTALPADFPPLHSVDVLPTNLPAALTPLIGRRAELAELAALLSSGTTRLVTLTGAGGVGKTRLALEVATASTDLFVDGTWWVELAALESADRVADAICRAIGLPEAPGVPAMAQLTRAVGDKRQLVVLDNCEHVIESCARVADELLRSCAHVTVVATSREPLGTASESVWRVPSLSLPPDTAPGLEDVVASDAVQLFVERGRQARSRFALSADNATLVAQICVRLDGIPLALELAAARLRVAPVEHLARDLNARFRVLTGGARTVLPRLQTLLASVDWSHDLLSTDERILFRRLGIFVSSFTLEAAEHVAGGDDLDAYQVDDLLGRLIDKSLVQFDDVTGRFQMLETIRQYALDRCRAAEELEHVRDRHLGWAIEFLERLDQSPDHDTCEGPVMAAIEADYPNVRAALEWATGLPGDASFRLVGSLATYWGLAGRHRDAVVLADPVLTAAREQDAVTWARLVSLLAWVRIVGGDVDFISNETVEALTIAREAGDDASQARCLYGLAAASTGESELFEAVYELGAAAGNVRFRNYGALLALFSVVGTEHADRLFQRAASVGADFDDETFLFLLPGMLAIHCSLRGDQARAAALFREALEHESRAIAAVFNIVGCAVFSALQGSDAELLRLASAYIGPDLRDLPGAEWWVQLLDDAALLTQPGSAPSSLPLPLPMFLVLLLSGLTVRLFLSGERFDDAERWALQVPDYLVRGPRRRGPRPCLGRRTRRRRTGDREDPQRAE